MFRPLSTVETAQVTPVLEVTSQWIRIRKPDIDDDDAAAKVVVFEVAREALTYGKFRPLSSFQETVGRRQKGGTFDASFVEQFITGRHRSMLGLQTVAAPAFNFPDCDY